jgi:hypothetical protein
LDDNSFDEIMKGIKSGIDTITEIAKTAKVVVNTYLTEAVDNGITGIAKGTEEANERFLGQLQKNLDSEFSKPIYKEWVLLKNSPNFSPAVTRLIWAEYQPPEVKVMYRREALVEAALENKILVQSSIEYLYDSDSKIYEKFSELLNKLYNEHDNLLRRFRNMSPNKINDYIMSNNKNDQIIKRVNDHIYSVCRRCKSDNIKADRNGFSGSAAIGGALIAGPVGLAAGLVGMNKVLFTCNKCGLTWYPKPDYTEWDEYRMNSKDVFFSKTTNINKSKTTKSKQPLLLTTIISLSAKPNYNSRKHCYQNNKGKRMYSRYPNNIRKTETTLSSIYPELYDGIVAEY